VKQVWRVGWTAYPVYDPVLGPSRTIVVRDS
jgi:hypothetical protein